MQPQDNIPLLAEEILKSIWIKTRALLILISAATMIGVFTLNREADFFDQVMEDTDGVRYLFLLIFAVMIIYELVLVQYLSRQMKQKGSEPVLLGYLNAVLEPTLISLILLIEITFFRTDAILISPVLLSYPIVIALSSLHLSWRISLCSGVVCAVEYLSLVMLLISNLDPSQHNEMVAHMPTHAVKAFFLFQVGCAAAFVAYRIRKGINNMTRMTQEKNFVVNVFGRYLTDEVADHILKSPAGLKLGGEKRTVTLMLTDLRGFTHLSDRLEAEAIVTILNNYLKEMIEIIARYRGTIDEIIGDAILVIFGAPLDSNQHAEQAVACALEMQLAMEGINQWNRDHGYPEIDMGIGVHTGSVVVGNIGSEKRSKYGVVGREINLTSRIESYTVGGQVLISEQTAAAVGEHLRIRWRREVLPKGFDQPIVICDVAGLDRKGDPLLLDEHHHQPQLLHSPVEAIFVALEGKDGGGESSTLMITALSKKEAICTVEPAICPLSNLKITLFDDAGSPLADTIVAKVTDEHDHQHQLHFTSIGPESEKMIAALLVD